MSKELWKPNEILRNTSATIRAVVLMLAHWAFLRYCDVWHKRLSFNAHGYWIGKLRKSWDIVLWGLNNYPYYVGGSAV